MKTALLFVAFLGVVLSVAWVQGSEGEPKTKRTEVAFHVPDNWPQPHYDFSKNPLTEEGIALGRKLFYDPRLSRDGIVSCASCHLSFTGFTHVDHALSHGVEDRIGQRNTSAIINPAWQNSFMWDGSINHLDMQFLAPMQNPAEMDGNLDTILQLLQDDGDYVTLFSKAFDEREPTIPNALKALSQFVLQFNSYNSKYDQVMRGDSGIAFTEREEKGLALFRQHCASCHQEPLFTNYAFKSNGLPIDTSLNDLGRYGVTEVPEDSLLFRVPTLRNIEVTYPYMHDGRYPNLAMVLFHYGKLTAETPHLSKELRQGLELGEKDKGALIAFLKTLTDDSFLRNRDLAFPR